LGGTALALLPVTLHNLGASGHIVPISSNGGLTFYHGNGPGARGVYTSPAGLSGDPLRQREEATALARARSGRDLDPVEADRWWGRQAIRFRLEHPAETVMLVGRRLLMTLDSHEYALDYAPELDTNPWRPVIRAGDRFRLPLVPLGLLLGLALVGWILRGGPGSGGWTTWAAVAACALTPLLFYVSSRYRLPLAATLVIPAGCGLAELFSPAEKRTGRRRAAALSLGAALCLASLLMPFHGLKQAMTGRALATRAVAYGRTGEWERARRDALRATSLAPDSAVVWFNAGSVAERFGDLGTAEIAYRRALALSPGLAEAAGNLAAVLIRAGRAAEAVPHLRAALVERPSAELCWNNLIVALFACGRLEEALQAVEEATENGVVAPQSLVEEIRAAHGAERAGPPEPEGELP
jgi:pentatricopeptide repeat protein